MVLISYAENVGEMSMFWHRHKQFPYLMAGFHDKNEKYISAHRLTSSEMRITFSEKSWNPVYPLPKHYIWTDHTKSATVWNLEFW